jgi:teichuronic acid biosynthesis glycosyltransferase TuaH
MKDSDSYYGDNSIVCISDLFWDEHWSSEQQLMSRFSEIWPVLYVERPVSILSFFTGISDASVGRQFLRWLKWGTRTEGKNLYVLTPPPFLPFRYNLFINKINQRIRNASIKRAMKKLGIERPILWIYEPDAAATVGKIDETLSIYHCADDWSSSRQWWNPVRNVTSLEDRLIKNASLLFVTSRQLFDDKKGLAKHIYYVPNGVSVSDFSASVQRLFDIEGIPRPIIGCVALFNDRYDYKMIHDVASCRADLSFVLVGNITTKDPFCRQLTQLSNVYFMGHKSRSLLGSYIANFDVCLIPYTASDFNKSAFPLKLMEYFFFGKPVVTLELPCMKEFDSLVYQYRNDREFVEYIGQALREEDPMKPEKRREIAMNNTWEQRCEEIKDIIVRHLGGKRQINRN